MYQKWTPFFYALSKNPLNHLKPLNHLIYETLVSIDL